MAGTMVGQGTRKWQELEQERNYNRAGTRIGKEL